MRTFGQTARKETGSTERAVSEQDLHDYVDGRLDAAGRARIETHLAANADDRAKVEAWHAINAGLRQLYGGALEEPAPEAMHRQLGKTDRG